MKVSPSRRILKLSVAVATAFSAALSITGCGAGGADDTAAVATATETDETVVVEEGNADAPAQAEQPAGGDCVGTHALTIAKPDGAITVQSNNPFVTTSSARTLGYINAMLEPVGMVNMADPSQEPIPWLASEIDWNDDYTVMTLTPREGVTWSDGTPFTVDDLAYTYELPMNDPALDGAALHINNVEVVDGKAVVTFDNSMYVRVPNVLHISVVPKHYMETISDLTTDPMLELPGTGPYTLTSFTSQAVVMNARDDYWGGQMAVPQLNFVSYNDNTGLITALANGEVDWAQAWIPNVQSAFLDHDAEHNHLWTPAGLSIDAMFVNTTRAPFDNVAFRQAVNMVIDREAHTAIAREGAIPGITSVTGLPTPAGDPFIAPQFQGENYVVDIDGAKQVLEDAGYTGVGTALVDPQGNPVTFTLSVPQGWSDYVTGSSLIVDAVQALGVQATLDTPDADTWWANRASGNFDAILHWTDGGSTPYQIYDNSMGGGWLVPIGESADFNFGRFDNPEAAALLTEYANATDEATRQEKLNEIQQIFVDEVPVMPIGTRPSIISYNTRNYTGWPDDSNPYIVSDFTQVWLPKVLQELRAVDC